MKITVDIVTGFLGAGKTALINSLIKETAIKDERILVVLLEDGNNKVNCSNDENLYLRVLYFKDNIKNIKDFLIDNINDYSPHRIIIEFNGTELLEDFLLNMYGKEFKKLLKVNCFYFICDAKTLNFYYKNMAELLHPCIEISDLLILNNCKSINQKAINECIELLQEINLKGHILTIKENETIQSKIVESKLLWKSKFRSFEINGLKHINKIWS